MTDSAQSLPSNAGYAENADSLVVRYESVTFDSVYGPLTAFVSQGGQAIDIGAGTGRDAAALAARGFSVIAVEPTAEMRAHGQRLHPDPAIIWCDDLLPDLSRARALGIEADFVLMTAVWMHLTEEERQRALPNVLSLLKSGGRLLMSIRKGPVPAGARMFEVPIAPFVEAAKTAGLELLQMIQSEDMHKRPGVSWTKLAFEKTKQA
ncbi:class I SAM-dependent methyltransferase [Microvirga terricola]|uniref:Class I SAM-dependent methyltransferase n=1 Tax=Microvirga terricola TaxID=2719797 RepID=A0ABX0V5X5_9HYPH|nr:class I SAM-dependent methyltransferase [Microvirga terricola]NIX75242.1 class I SAM-dependent methyltransferase [Microvirga terricola]